MPGEPLVGAPTIVVVGLTLLTVTDVDARLLVRVVESVTCRSMLTVPGPSGKLTWKLPPAAVVTSEPGTRLPPAPMVKVLTVNESPGSFTAKL